MKKAAPIYTGILICILVIGGAYIWATGLMDSLYSYRSPLRKSPPLPGEAVGALETRSLVIVLIDGLRYDTSINSMVMPYLNQIRKTGAFAEMHSQPPSYSQAAFTTLLTGAWPDINDGPALNLDFAEIPKFTQDDIFSAAHRSGLHTAISGFNWFLKQVPQESVSTSFYTPGEDQIADRDVVDAALPWLQAGNYQLVLIHLDQVDYAGHYEGGPADPRWNIAATRVDNLLKEIVLAMNLREDTLMVVSDHGHIKYGGHGGQDASILIEPFILVGKSVMPGNYGDIQMVDVAPTASVILGTNLPASNQGHPQVAMIDLSLTQLSQINQALSLQQAQLVQAYGSAIGQPVKVQLSSDIVAASQAAIQAARKSLLDWQMLPRGIIALFIAVLLVNLAAWHAKPNFGSMLVGVLGYLAIFNLKYLWIDHKTYSLSSVKDAMNLITSTALTVLIALLVGWIIVMISTKIYQYKPRKAADVSMKFILVLLSILAIPALVNYAFNGLTVTWTLPNFLVSFMGLIFLIQAMMTGAIGILFTGLAALLGVFSRQR